MMKKTIKTSSKKRAEVLNPEKPKIEAKAETPKVNPLTFNFPKGTFFNMNQQQHYVKEARFDSNTEFRVIACEGNETVMMLPTLQKNAAESADFFIVKGA